MTRPAGAIALAAVALAAAACGGRAPAPVAAAVAPPEADAGVPDEPEPDSAPLDPCAGYALAVAPPLGRLDAAMQRAGSRLAARDAATKAAAARELADSVELEAGRLRAIVTGDDELDGHHQALVAALGDLARALRALAEGIEANDRAGLFAADAQLKAAFEAWSRELGAIRRRCPA